MEQQTIQEEEKQQQEPQKSSFLSDVAEILETVFVSIFVVILQIGRASCRERV